MATAMSAASGIQNTGSRSAVMADVKKRESSSTRLAQKIIKTKGDSSESWWSVAI